MQSKTKKKKGKGDIITWVICIAIVLAGAIIVIYNKMPEEGSSYDHMKYSSYISKLGEYKGIEGGLLNTPVTRTDVSAEIASRVSEAGSDEDGKPKYRYNETFLKECTDYDNKKDYEKAVKKELQEQKNLEALNNCKTSLWNKVLEATEVSKYPKPLYKTEKAKLLENAQETASHYGMSWEDYLSAMGMDEESFNEQLKTETKALLKENMTARYIAKEEGIRVTKDDTVEHLREELEEHGMSEEDFEEAQGMTLEEYAKNNDMTDHILLEKVQDFIYDNAKIATVEIDGDAPVVNHPE